MSGLTEVAPLEAIRAQFPALERSHNGLPVAYFDGPGGTQVPQRVTSAVSDYLIHHNANTHWAYPTSEETDAALASARQALADFLNATPDEIVFGANMTTLAYHVSRALARRLGPGDEVVVTELDHQANVAPWQALARERGVTLRTVSMCPESGQLDTGDFERVLGSRTRLVAVGAASNALGTINAVPAICRMAHDCGALAFVDAVHYAPHRLVDVRALGCDFLACSAYKFYGPHVGVLFGKRELLQELEVPKLDPAPDQGPERWETGTQNHEGIVGTAAAIDFLASLAGSEGNDRRLQLAKAYAELEQRGETLLRQAWDGLSRIAGVRLYGPPPGQPRTPTLAFSVEGIAPGACCQQLARRAIFATHGDFYATRAVARLGHAADGLVRIGCACYTSTGEVERLVDALRAIIRGAR